MQNQVTAVPFQHESIENWRSTRNSSLKYQIPNTNLVISGVLDDVWKDCETGKLHVVEYKATSKKNISLDDKWSVAYKRQVEVYQWLLRKNGFKVSNIAYFVYCNGKKDVPCFGNQLHFDIELLSYAGNDSWVEDKIFEAYKCLQLSSAPEMAMDCGYCKYSLVRAKYFI